MTGRLFPIPWMCVALLTVQQILHQGVQRGLHRAVQRPHTVTVFVTPTPAHVLVPTQAFGAALDGLSSGDVERVYTPTNVAAMLGAGFVPITYRLRTELAIEAWHWNAQGTWSDATHTRGYWTSAPTSTSPIDVSYGYRLPRRGNTIDQANDDGYSRLDDGDTSTFWKSNPYLDDYYTHEPPEGNSEAHRTTRHPQWIVVDFRDRVAINAVRIHWGEPYATHFLIQWWDQVDSEDAGAEETIPDGHWRTFPRGAVEHATGGDMLIRVDSALGNNRVHTRLIRVLMTRGSRTALPGSHDVRDSLGVAIREVSAGVVRQDGVLHDAMRHAPSGARQTVTYASSTDPWHRASERDRSLEQPGFDKLYRSGLTRGQPVTIPVGVVYDTPENAAAELRFLQGRGYPVARIEMGEEPDGQSIAPEDYAALYLQFADALRGVNRTIVLGGPGFQDAVAQPSLWPDTAEDRSWMRRFLSVMRRRHRLGDFQFFSFEWYPYDDVCGPSAPQLAQETGKLAAALDTLRGDGVPRDIPWLMTEYGYSAFAGRSEVEMAGALLNADIVGQFLTLGGTAAYVYGYEPTEVMRNEQCNSWGNNTILLARERQTETQPKPVPVATYYAAQLLTQEWVQPGNAVHRLYRAQSDIVTAAGEPLVTAYAVRRPDDSWSVLLVNKDPLRAWPVRVVFQVQGMREGGDTIPFHAPFDMYQYSAQQYVWRAHGADGYPSPDRPPAHSIVSTGDASTIRLPPYSLTVIRSSHPSNRPH